jgi:hypothetical protein
MTQMDTDMKHRDVTEAAMRMLNFSGGESSLEDPHPIRVICVIRGYSAMR